ncbi:MAG: E3 binding domain-containing protein, partial [Solirubrobacterales bacterium]|nr:E3 binding domain-containing protein [Solirubrobacterales bacterium]
MSAGSDVISVEVPDIGDFEDVPIIEILVSPGDTVAVDDPLLTLESDKATMDVPAPAAGVIKELRVSVGDKVSQGTLLLMLESSNGDSAEGPSKAAAAASEGAPDEAAAPEAVRSAIEAEEPSMAEQPPAPKADAGPPTGDQAPPTGDGAPPQAQAAPQEQAAPPEAPAPPAGPDGGGPIYASPAVRRLARELGVDLSRLHGTGRKGRILKDDVR